MKSVEGGFLAGAGPFTTLWERMFEGEARYGLPPRAWGVLFAISFIALWPGQITLPPMDRDESRYAQAARQMLETGDFIDIRFQEQARHVKPAGVYWLMAVSAAPFGGPDAPIWVFRLPSLLAALLTVAVTAWLGARMADARTGFAAGALLAVSLAISVEARTAKTDAVLLLSVVAAQAALFFIMNRKAEGRTPFWGAPAAFWLAQGAGLMVKGPIITLVSGTTLLALCLWRRDVSVLRRLRAEWGVVLMIAVAAPWLIAITLKTGGGFLEQSLGHALAGKVAQSDDSHGAPPGYHTLFLLATFWPGIAFAGLAGGYAWLRRREADVQFLIAWILPTWIVFELVVTKLPHYVVPVFPALALLTAKAIMEAPQLFQNARVLLAHRVGVIAFTAATMVICAVPLGARAYLGMPVSVGAGVAGALGVCVLAAGALAAFRPSGPRVLAMSSIAALFYAVVFHAVAPGLSPIWPSAKAAQVVAQADEFASCETVSVATAGYREPSNVFHFGTLTVLGDGEEAAAHLLAHKDCGAAIVDESERAAFMGGLAAAGERARAIGRVEGLNYSKGDVLFLEVYVLGGVE